MKLIRFGESGQELDCSGFGEDYHEAFFDSDGIGRLEKWLAENQKNCDVVPPETRLGSPVGRPSKIICIGLNFKDHAEESGMTPPTEPVVFFKATSAIVGPNDDLILPRGGEKTDWEVELAVVIGKKASYVEEADAMDYVAGYCLHNDYSESTFAPLGPFMATKDEISDVNALGMWLTVNGKKLQNGSTANFIFDVAHVISYLSRHMTLLPGDVISTGTPAGVGLGFDPPVYLKAGDVVELGIEGLGESRQEVKPWRVV